MTTIQDRIRKRNKKIIRDNRKKRLNKFTSLITTTVIEPGSFVSFLTIVSVWSLFLYFLGVWLVVLLIGA